MKKIFMFFLMVLATSITICAQKVTTNYPACATGKAFKVEVTLKPEDYKSFMQLTETVKKNQDRIDLAMSTQVMSPTGSESVLLGKQLLIGNCISTIDKSHISMDKIIENYLSIETRKKNMAAYKKLLNEKRNK